MTSVVIAGYARSPFHFAKKGALVLSRSVADTELADRILDSTRRHLKREIGAAE